MEIILWNCWRMDFFSFSFPMKDPSLRVKDKICNLGQNICRLFYVLAVSPYHE